MQSIFTLHYTVSKLRCISCLYQKIRQITKHFFVNHKHFCHFPENLGRLFCFWRFKSTRRRVSSWLCQQTFLFKIVAGNIQNRFDDFFLDNLFKVGGDGQAWHCKNETGEKYDALVVGDPVDVKTQQSAASYQIHWHSEPGKQFLKHSDHEDLLAHQMVRYSDAQYHGSFVFRSPFG